MDMMFPHTVTLYNKYLGGNTERWQRIVLRGVYWDSSKGRTIRENGLSADNGLVLIIPFSVAVDGDYCKPKEFASLTDRTGKWTLASGDMVVLGDIEYEVERSTKELQRFDDLLTISYVDTRDYGGNMAHWEVTGK